VTQSQLSRAAERRVARRTVGFFDVRSTALVAVLGLAFVMVVALVNYLIRPDISLTLFYLMPIGLVTWNLGRSWGVTAVIVSTIVGLAGDLMATGEKYNLYPYWNAIVRFAVFLAFAMLLATLKTILDAQSEEVVRETQVSSGLRELNDVKDTLLHAVSHDLKNPLAGILGAMQTIRRDDELHLTDEERETLYEVIEKSGRKMDRLIDDLLDLDRIDRGSVLPDRRPTDVGEIARRVANECQDLLASPVRVEADEVMADVDPAKVERIIENLLVNAARHTPAGTAVGVRVSAGTAEIAIVVEDAGPGVPDELKEELFEPFRQGKEAGGRGLGIGLSLVRKFAELHGGTARVEDRVGGGARFVVTLPCTVRPKTGSEPEGEQDDGSPRLRAV
jgi:signal transduction histidine kinase